jgi:hypothetical protein
MEPDLRKLYREDSLGDIDPKRAAVVKVWQKRVLLTPDYQVTIDSPEGAFQRIEITKDTEYRTPDEDEWVGG